MLVFSTFAKATYATVVSALGSLATVLVGDSAFSAVTAGQWVTVALAALLAGGGVYGITNTKPTAPAKGGSGGKA